MSVTFIIIGLILVLVVVCWLLQNWSIRLLRAIDNAIKALENLEMAIEESNAHQMFRCQHQENFNEKDS